MNNYFLDLRKKRESTPKKATRLKQISIVGSLQRRQQFMQNMDQTMADCLLYGSDNFYQHPKKQDNMKPFHTCLHRTSKERVDSTFQDYRSSHLDHLEYVRGPQDLGHYLRQRVKSMEGPTITFDVKPHLRKDEAEWTHKKNSVVDCTSKDMEMVYFPKWRKQYKHKWVDKRPFNSTVISKQEQVKFYRDVYIDGYEVIGDISRKSTRNSSDGRQQFISTATPKANDESTSIRKGYVDSVLSKNISNSGCSTTISRCPKIYCKSIRDVISQQSQKYQ